MARRNMGNGKKGNERKEKKRNITSGDSETEEEEKENTKQGNDRGPMQKKSAYNGTNNKYT